MAQSVYASLARKSAASVALTASIMLGGSAHADDIVNVHGKIPLYQKYDQLVGLVDKVTSPSDVLFKKQLIETATHESGNLKFSRRAYWNKTLHRWDETGPDRSIFMIQPGKTGAGDIIGRWLKKHPREIPLAERSSGMRYKDLALLSDNQVGDLLMKKDFFAAAMARFKYLSTKWKPSDDINVRAFEWSRYYQGTRNPVERQQYIDDTKRMSMELKASHLGGVMGKHIHPMKPTAGIVHKMHNNKIGHNIASVAKKLARMRA